MLLPSQEIKSDDHGSVFSLLELVLTAVEEESIPVFLRELVAGVGIRVLHAAGFASLASEQDVVNVHEKGRGSG
jgi:hypothetical protein